MARKYEKTTKVSSSSRNTANKGKSSSQRSISSGMPGKKSGRSTATYQPKLLPYLRKSFSRILGKSNRRQPARSAPVRTAPARAKPPEVVKPAHSGLSLDRKLDITGIVLVFAGILTLLSLFSSSNSPTTQGWLSFLGHTFGWGAFVFPVGLLAIGLWLILRKFERIPQLSFERTLGLLFAFFLLLVILHFVLLPRDQDSSYMLASEAKGGGVVGAFVFELLRTGLGWGGTAIILLAWIILSLAIIMDRPVAVLFNWIPASFVKLRLRIQDTLEARRNHRTMHTTPPAASSSSPASSAPEGEWQPFLPLSSSFQSGSTSDKATGQLQRPYVLPDITTILEPGEAVARDDEFDRQKANLIEETLASFGAPAHVVEINRGPTITQYGVEPDFVETRSGRMRVRVGKIAALQDDLALALSARTIRVQAPVPGKGFVGIEVPNENVAIVALRDVIGSEAFRRLKSPLRFALGEDVAGNAVAADLSAMPHLLIAGATGTGKSVCVNSVISCLLLHNTPDDLRLIMIDPKRVELTGYNGIPHLLAPVVVDLERVVGALQWVLREMDMRYQKLAQAGSRDIASYNDRLAPNSKKLPRLVVIIDELADLMMLAPDETERSITRLAQLARATGIHLVISTQRPSVDVVTGVIKANFPARIAFAVASGVDSRVVLDQPGAERLLGSGDMLFQAPDAPQPLRLQGTFVSDSEIQALVAFWQSFAGGAAAGSMAAGGIVDAPPPGVPLKQIPLWDDMFAEEQSDPLLNEAIDLARRQGRASISMLQRRLRIGYTRSARLIETMQTSGIIGTETGPQGFEVLDYGPAAPPVEEARE